MTEPLTVKHPKTGVSWAFGMSWSDVKLKGKRPVKKGCHLFTVQKTEGKGKERQTRYAHQLYPTRKPLHSLALAFCEQYQNGYGIYQVSETHYVFMSSTGGLPNVFGDATGDLKSVQDSMALFLQMNDEPAGGWDICSPASEVIDWQTLSDPLSKVQVKSCRLKPPVNRVAIALILLSVIGAGAAYWFHLEKIEEAKQQAAIALFKQKQLAKNPELGSLPHPWATQPPASAMADSCEIAWLSLPVTPGGWLLKGAVCDTAGIYAQWQPLPGATAQSINVAIAKIWPGKKVTLDLMKGGQQASLRVPVNFTPGRDEKVPDKESQLLRVGSYFMGLGKPVSFIDKTPPDPVAKEGEPPPPRPTWKTFAFESKSESRPSVLLSGLNDIGLRITSITFRLEGSAPNYSLQGVLYAAR